MHKQIPISEATTEQLRQFVETVLGADDLSDNPRKGTLLAKMKDMGWAMDTIPDLGAPVVPTATEGAGGPRPIIKNENGVDRTYYKVLIHTQPTPGGERAVELGVNGKRMAVPRGKEVEIPEEYVEALKNAVHDVYDPVPADAPMSQQEQGLGTPRKVQAYPFTFV